VEFMLLAVQQVLSRGEKRKASKSRYSVSGGSEARIA
jgi:hypothetical protein